MKDLTYEQKVTIGLVLFAIYVLATIIPDYTVLFNI